MSGKRRADNQVTRENLHEHERSDDDDAPQGPTQASAAVLAKRKILKPRSRLNRQAGSGTGAPAPSSGFNFGAPAASTSNSDGDKPANPFGGFGGFGQQTAAAPKSTFNFGQSTTSAEDKPKPNPFGFLNKDTSSSTATAEAPAEDKPKTNVFSFLNNSNNSTSETSLTKTTPTQLTSTKEDKKPNKIKALNDTFYDRITEQKQADPVSNFTPILRKYIDYYEKIENDPEYLPDADDQSTQPQLENKEEQKSLPAPSFNFGQKKEPAAITFGSSSNDKPAAAATTAAPTFTFGASKPREEKEPTPMDETKDTTATSIKNDDDDKEVVNVSDDSDSDSDDDIKVEGPKFTLAAPPTTTDSVFKLDKSTSNSKPASTSTGPSFTFSADTSKKFDNPFKLPPPEKKEEESKPAPAPATSNFSWNPEKPIKFGASNDDEEKKETPKPTFNFGGQSSNAAPSFNFTAPTPSSSDSKENDKPKFTFGTSSAPAEKKDDAKPTFNFGGASTTSSSDQPKPTFSFGSNNTASADKKDDAKPTFNFGSNSTSTAPSFNFGDSASKPAFSFGQGSSTFNFNLGGNKDTSASTSSNGDSANKDDDDKVPEEEPQTNFKPVVQLTEKVEDKTGEEEEEVTYTKRSKLSLFIPSNKETPYESKGLGELKVLKHKETQKSRILVRSDGANRVLLNASVSKDFKYDTIGNGNTVRIPVVSAEGKIETYLARVKTPEDGANLLKALQDAQQ